MPHPVLALDETATRRLEDLCRRTAPSPGAPATFHSPTHGLLISQRLETRWTRTWRCSTEEAAAAWNEGWDRVLSDPAFSHPALLSPIDALREDQALELVAWIASALLDEELRAGTPPPTLRPGCGFELTVMHQFEMRPFPTQREELLIRLSWCVLAPSDEPVWTVECVREYDLRRMPGNAARILLAAPTRHDSLEAVGCDESEP